MCFLPSESLLASALDEDPTLLDYAFTRRVALASPVNLWAVLKTVAFTWTQQDVSDEARTLFALGTELYERVGVLAGHANELRRAIEKTVDSYNRFAGSLESRVLVTARKFPGIDETKLDAVAAPAALDATPRAGRRPRRSRTSTVPETPRSQWSTGRVRHPPLTRISGPSASARACSTTSRERSGPGLKPLGKETSRVVSGPQSPLPVTGKRPRGSGPARNPTQQAHHSGGDGDERADHPPRADLVPLIASNAQQHVRASRGVDRAGDDRLCTRLGCGLVRRS